MSKQTSVAEEIRKRSRPCVYLYRTAASYLRAGTRANSVAEVERAAHQLFGDDTPTFALVRRAATVPATTTGLRWADALAGKSVFDAVQAPTSVSAAAALIGHALHVDLTGVAAVVVPGRVVTADAAGQWVAEAGAKPVRMLNFSSVTLEPRKLAVIMVFTREMAESSNIEAVVKQTLGEASGLALDAAMFSAAPGDDTRPAGLLSAPPLAPAPAGPSAMVQDLGALISALASGGAGLAPAIVASPAQAFAVKLQAGPHFDAPVLAAAAIPSRTVIAVEASSLAVGFDATPEFHVSPAGTLHMEDTTPSTPTSPPASRSMFQTSSLALKMMLRASWAMRASGHVAWTTNVNW